MQAVFYSISQYILALDWSYMLTFILISYALTHYKVSEFIAHGLGFSLQTRYQVVVIGFLYGILTYFINGYEFLEIQRLFQSFVFAMIFHKLLLENLFDPFLRRKRKDAEYPEDEIL
ncbi:hypothetical protein [Aquimarina pacifica]|uniref:hypothetical protein n=1 Tax=Aquimarina pacifica TaxID=1296415 RepID=UPI0004714E99|nr:hypothetical protein [Aquimarina pacifica]